MGVRLLPQLDAHFNFMINYGNMVGDVYGRLTVLERMANDKNNQKIWLCVCECGNTIKVKTSYLKRGHTKSCGCLRAELMSENMKTHGMTKKIPEYEIWCGMRARCANMNNPDYGGRGISVCDRWMEEEKGFVNFLEDMGRRPNPKLSIERKNNDGNYEPVNCYWETKRVQAGNRRSNRRIEWEGRNIILMDWAREINVDYSYIVFHLRKGRNMGEIIEFYKNKRETDKRVYKRIY